MGASTTTSQLSRKDSLMMAWTCMKIPETSSFRAIEGGRIDPNKTRARSIGSTSSSLSHPTDRAARGLIMHDYTTDGGCKEENLGDRAGSGM